MEEGLQGRQQSVGQNLIKSTQATCSNTSSSEAAAAKQAEAARKKAEKEALLKEEEASLPSKPGKKAPVKKARGLDLSGLDAPSSKKELSALNATGIDDALDALDLTKGNNDKIDRHPRASLQGRLQRFRGEEAGRDEGREGTEETAEDRPDPQRVREAPGQPLQPGPGHLQHVQGGDGGVARE